MAVMALVIEDQEDARLALKTVLEDIGYGVWEAAGGSAGLEAAATNMPDVVLLDLMLPDMPGLDVLRSLKQDSRTAPIPVIVVSALGTSEALRDAVRAGASDYLVKPWADADLETALEWALKKNGKQAPLRVYRNRGVTPNDWLRRNDGPLP